MSGKSVIGVNSVGEIYYTADITSPSWSRVWGELQTLSMSAAAQSNQCSNFDPSQGVCSGISPCSDNCPGDFGLVGYCFTTTDGYNICNKDFYCDAKTDCVSTSDCPYNHVCMLSCCNYTGSTGKCVSLAETCTPILFESSANPISGGGSGGSQTSSGRQGEK